jgi:esterase/lipase superfamily enzyme
MDEKLNFDDRVTSARVIAIIAGLAILLVGCATPPKIEPVVVPPERVERGIEPNFSVQRVYFATDRATTGSQDPVNYFGSEKAEKVSYGVCEVSIPRDHRMGELEGPSVWRMEFQPDPNKHVVFAKIELQEKSEFFNELKSRLHESEGKKAFVFIHGFNVAFKEAARRTAQIHYDLAFTGVPIFFSWPSQSELIKYRDDEKMAKWSEAHLKDFFGDLASRLDADEIYVVAHSMGNRPASRALGALFAERPDLATRFKEIILVAPDIDAKVFKEEIAPPLLASNRHLTLYASSNDKALKLSEFVNGGGQRLGDSYPSIVLLPGMKSIDASSVETDLLGHSYYVEVRSVLSDLFEIVRDTKSATEHSFLEEVLTPQGSFWKFKPQQVISNIKIR